MQKDQMEQRNHQQKRREAEQAEEDSLRQQMLAKFAEDDRIELMNAQKRRMKQLEHKKVTKYSIIARVIVIYLGG